jgi:hypothetical protein
MAPYLLPLRHPSTLSCLLMILLHSVNGTRPDGRTRVAAAYPSPLVAKYTPPNPCGVSGR